MKTQFFGKRVFTLFFAVSVVALLFSGCMSKPVDVVSNELNIVLPIPDSVEYEDSHSGFFGDGTEYAKFSFEPEKAVELENELESDSNWNKMPLDDELRVCIYGGELDGITYESFFEGIEIPPIQNGYWFFYDRHSESTDRKSCDELLDRSSYNFTVGLYDTEAKTLYFLKLDT